MWIDKAKEKELEKFRVQYTFEKWAEHRSTKRYAKHFLGLFYSRILASLRVPLLLIALESCLVCVWESALAAGMLPAGFRSVQVKVPNLFSLSSFALSLLLVFRTNQSYARFDEGRRLWGTMVNRCRDFMRMATSFLGPEQRPLVKVLSRWVAAFPWVMKNWVREEKRWQEELGPWLKPEELSALVASPHPPLFALAAMTEVADRGDLTEKQRLGLDAALTALLDMCGACERILTTPIPVSYTRHTARFLVIWLGLLPFSIYQSCGWVTVLSSVVLGFCLLSIDEIGVSLEEPFNILPLEGINIAASRTVMQSVDQLDGIMAMVDRATGTTRRVAPFADRT